MAVWSNQVEKLYKTIHGAWTINDEESGELLAEFQAFLDFNYSAAAAVTEYGVERGGFMSVNKTVSPEEVRVTMAAMGSADHIANIHQRLEDYRRNTRKINIHTPNRDYIHCTLLSISLGYSVRQGARMTTFTLAFKEVAEVSAGYGYKLTVDNVKNPESADTVNRGTVQTQTASEREASYLYDMKEKVLGLFK